MSPYSPHTRMQTETEKWPSLALLPLAATILFYLFPHPTQAYTIAQFLPQILAYTGLGLWACANDKLSLRLGIHTSQLWLGLRWGCLVGLLLGIGNSFIILNIVPALGMDITFLGQTPHAQVPTVVMIPWTITAIAIAVEFNFRGFLLGRLITLITCHLSHTRLFTHTIAILLSALIFAFDPFMVATFQHLHWIAVWDGMIWGWMWVRFNNLYAVIAAHAIEVMVLYIWIKTALT
ncbi:CPBP family glutamic-type intramembrane protease [Nitrospira sp. M1]